MKPIIDKFGRVHDYLRISLTERCNLRCTYCMPEEGVELSPKNKLMTYEEIIQISKIFVNQGVKKIRLTGGEPLVRKDVDFIILALSEIPVELCMTTNGILIDKHINTLKKSSIRKLNVSLDTLDATVFKNLTKRNVHSRVLKNIDLLKKEGFEVKVNVVLQKHININEIINFIEYADKLNLIVQFIEFMPFVGNNWNMDQTITKNEVLEIVSKHYGDKIDELSKSENDTSSNYALKGKKGGFSIISSVTNPFCDTCNRIRLTANGSIKNCLFSNEETNLLDILRSGGNVEKIIYQCIERKKYGKGGWKNFEDMQHDKQSGSNRAMILIGG